MAGKVTKAGEIKGAGGTLTIYKGVELPPAPEPKGLIRREPRWGFRDMEPGTSTLVPYEGTDADANKNLFKQVSAAASSLARQCRDNGELHTYAVREVAGKTPGVGVWCVALEKALPPRVIRHRRKKNGETAQAAPAATTEAASAESGEGENPFG